LHPDPIDTACHFDFGFFFGGSLSLPEAGLTVAAYRIRVAAIDGNIVGGIEMEGTKGGIIIGGLLLAPLFVASFIIL